jgi:RNA polymerase sigma-70 factor (ECF subfamily)
LVDVSRVERTDAELLAASGSDPDAFVAFYDRYEAAVCGFLTRRAGDPELAADLSAEVFAAVFSAARRYRPQSPSAAPWLFTIAQNTLSRSVRRGRVESRARYRLGIRDALEFTPDVLDGIETMAAGDGWLLALLERLPADQRDAIRARVIEERPYGEIATEMDTSPLVIRKRVSRGLASLREKLEESP